MKMIDIYFKCNTPRMKASIAHYLEACEKSFQKIEYKEKGKLKGFVFYHIHENVCVFMETHFDTKNIFAFLKCLKQASKGCKSIVLSTNPLNKKILAFYERLGAQFVSITEGNLVYELKLRGDI